jgi:hypothetical protein
MPLCVLKKKKLITIKLEVEIASSLNDNMKKVFRIVVGSLILISLLLAVYVNLNWLWFTVL